jgi:uncharacterized protein (DUF3084 family)
MKPFKYQMIMKLRKLLKYGSVSLIIALIITGCQDKAPKEVKMFDEKMEKTIAIHDSVMPKMGEMSNLMKKLEQKKDSLSETKEVQAAKQDLEQSHDQMMTWMKDLSNTFTAEQINQGIKTRDVDSLKKALKELDKLKNEAESMQRKINSSIEQAEELLSTENK